jgi:thermosome
MDKMLVTGLGDVTITNDGAAIMKDLEVQHPVAKMLVELAKTQDREVGDGTTTAVILAGSLLKEAEKLIDQDLHASIIVEGFRRAAERAIKILHEMAVPLDPKEESILKRLAETSMGTKGVSGAKEHLARIAVEAVKRIAETSDGKTRADIDLVKIIKKHGKSIEESELVRGFVLDKELAHSQMPKQIRPARVALLNSKLEIKKTEFDAKLRITSPEQMRMFLAEEEHMLKDMVEKISKTGANFVVCEKGIDDLVLHFFAKKGIGAVKNASSSDMEKLSKATGGKIVANIDELTADSLGEAGLVEEVKIGEDKLVYLRECKNPRALAIVLRGGTQHVVDEAERSVHDALCVVRDAIEDRRIVAGGGAPEAEISARIRKYAPKVGGREQLAIEAFASALEAIPMTLAENAGLDPVDIMMMLRAKHEDPSKPWFGVDAASGKVKDMMKLGVIEPLRVKEHAIKSATEAASMILRIDDVISAGRLKEEEKGKPSAGPERYGY